MAARPGKLAYEVRHLTIEDDAAGQRLDNYLLRILKGLPRSRIYSMLRKGEVRVNKGRAKPSYRVVAGDRLRVPPVRIVPQRPKAPPPARVRDILESRIVFEDKKLLVIDKPAGMAVHGGSGSSYGVIEALRAARPEEPYLELVHRLDKDTSGCLLIARRRSMLRRLHTALREGKVDKRYLALVRGQWHLGTRWVDAPLETRSRAGSERHVVVHPDGKPARTRFSPVQIFKQATLMEAQLDTGRTHQIRVHAAYMEHPLAGDERYGDRDFDRSMAALGLDRLFLHAHSIGFELEDGGGPCEVSVPLPDELARVLDNLESGEG